MKIVKLNIIWQEAKAIFYGKLRGYSVLPNPQSIGDEALTWTLWAIVAGAIIPFIALTASVFMHPLHEGSSVLVGVMEKVLDKNLLLYFSIEIIIAATADYYIVSLKNSKNISIKINESFLFSSIKYGMFPALVFTTALVTLIASFADTKSADITNKLNVLYFHGAIFMATIIYVFMIRYRCGYLSECNNVNSISSHHHLGNE